MFQLLEEYSYLCYNLKPVDRYDCHYLVLCIFGVNSYIILSYTSCYSFFYFFCHHGEDKGKKGALLLLGKRTFGY